jgi:predicted PurR-regulated permease PerM
VSSGVDRPYRVVLFAFGLIVLAVVVAWAAKALLVLFAGSLFALVLHGVATAIARRTRLPYLACVAAVVVALITSTVLTLVLLGPSLFDQLRELVERLPGAVRDVLARLHGEPIGRALTPSPGAADANTRAVAARAVVALGTTLEVLGGLLVIFFVGVYGAARPSDYTRAVFVATPRAYRTRVLRALRRASATLTRWLMCRLVSMLFVGVTCAIAFSLLHVPLAMSLALLAGVLTFVEYVGAILSAIPPILLALTRGPGTALAVVIVYTVLHVIDGYVLTPVLARATVRFPPALMLAGQLVLAALLGPLGLMFSTPLWILVVSMVSMLTAGGRSGAQEKR